MNQDRLNREWIDLAPAWIREAREGVNPTRAGLLDKPMLQACGNVAGLRILDCGCGEGRFCRMLARQGVAYVLGLDLCEPMIDAANELRGERDEYRVADVQDLGFLDPESFDLCGLLSQSVRPARIHGEQLFFAILAVPRKGAKRATYMDVPKPVFARDEER